MKPAALKSVPANRPPLTDIKTLRAPKVLALINAAIAQAETRLPLKGAGSTVIQSVSSKQRPRRKPAKTA